MRLKAIHALQQLLCAGPCRLALIVAFRLTATLADVALFLGHLAHGFHRVAVLFRVFTVALRDEPSNLRRISPLLGTLCLVLGLWPLWWRYAWGIPRHACLLSTPCRLSHTRIAYRPSCRPRLDENRLGTSACGGAPCRGSV